MEKQGQASGEGGAWYDNYLEESIPETLGAILLVSYPTRWLLFIFGFLYGSSDLYIHIFHHPSNREI